MIFKKFVPVSRKGAKAVADWGDMSSRKPGCQRLLGIRQLKSQRPRSFAVFIPRCSVRVRAMIESLTIGCIAKPRQPGEWVRAARNHRTEYQPIISATIEDEEGKRAEISPPKTLNHLRPALQEVPGTARRTGNRLDCVVNFIAKALCQGGRNTSVLCSKLATSRPNSG